MIIGLISDTHDALPVLSSALELFKSRSTNLIVHCGDWKSPATARNLFDLATQYEIPLQGVLGNNDTAIGDFKALGLIEGVLTLEYDGRRMAAYHGHHKPTLNTLLANEDHNDALFLGHSHKPRDEHINGSHIINPGSTAFSIPRSRSWQPTIALHDTTTDQAEILTVSA